MVSIPNGIILNSRGQANSVVTMEGSGNIGAGICNSSLNKRNWMIYFYYTRKDFYECKVVIQDELKFSNGYNEFANYMLGIIVRDEGRIQDSLNCFKKCNSLNPKNAENLRQIGRSLYLLGRYELAIEAFLKAEKLSAYVDWNIFYNLGICYMKTSKFDKGKEYLTRAVDLGKSEQSFLALSKIYLLQHDLLNAIDVLKASLRLYPGNVDLYVNLGLVFVKTSEYHKAFNELGTALGYEPSNVKALFTFAAEIQRHGEYDVAISKYKILAQYLSNSSELWNNVAMCFFGKRKYVAAITCLKRSYYLAPLNWLTLFNLGLLHLNTRQFASAAIFLSSAAKLNNQHASTFTLLAIALKNLGDVVNCQKSFEEALKRNPNDIEACVNYTLFLYSIGDSVRTNLYFTRFKQLLESCPSLDKELYNMSSALEKLLTKKTGEYEDNENNVRNGSVELVSTLVSDEKTDVDSNYDLAEINADHDHDTDEDNGLAFN